MHISIQNVHAYMYISPASKFSLHRNAKLQTEAGGHQLKPDMATAPALRHNSRPSSLAAIPHISAGRYFMRTSARESSLAPCVRPDLGPLSAKFNLRVIQATWSPAYYHA